MAIEMPCEQNAKYILPAIRVYLTKALKKHNLTQKDIAKLFGVTEAAVSQYMKGKRGAKELPDKTKKAIEGLARKIEQHRLTDQGIKDEICKLCKQTKLVP